MRLDHLLSKDRSKGCVSGKLSCVKNPAPREMEDIGRGTGSPEDGFHLPGRTRREAPLDGISPKCGAFQTVPDLIKLSLSGGDARRGNTRSHPEHDG